MRAQDILPDHIDHGSFDGVVVRKGTVAAFLANAKTLARADATAAERAAAQRDIADSLPALRALGLFDVLAIRDDALRAWVDAAQA